MYNNLFGELTMHNSFRRLLVLILVFTMGVTASQITQYGPTNIVTGVADQGDSLWLTTGGGLLCFLHSKEEVVLHEHSNSVLPDISLRTPVLAEDGTLWFTSATGYLYHRNKRGRIETFEDLIPAAAIPYSLIQYDANHLFIGHSKGISVFDIEKGKMISTASDGAVSGRVFSLFVEEDTLFAGVEKTIVRIDEISKRYLSRDFRVDTNWVAVDTMALEVNGLVHDSSGIRGFSRTAVIIDNNLFYGQRTVDYYKTTTNEDKSVDTTDTIFAESFIAEYANGTSDTISLAEYSGLTDIAKISGNVIISTEEDYILSNVTDNLKQNILPGIVFGQFQNSLIASNGDMWLATTLSSSTQTNRNTWWRGIHRMTQDGQYFHYNEKETPGFGSVENYHIRSMTESRDGKIWLTTWGGSGVKMWDPQTDAWVQYRPYDYFNNETSTLEIITDGRHDWVKCDAVVQDSMGYMWIVQYSTGVGHQLRHRFLIVDPETNEYTFVFDREDTRIDGAYFPYVATVDSKGNRIFIDPDKGERIVISSDINPFTDTTRMYTEGVGYNISKVSKKVSHMAPAPSGGAVITVGEEGLSLIRNDVDSIANNGIVLADSFYHANSGDFLKAGISAVVEGATTEYNVTAIKDSTFVTYDSVVTTNFWAAITEIGVERFTVVERIKKDEITGKNVSEAILILPKNPVILNDEERFSFGPPGTLMIDRKRNHLWMSSPKGLVRYQMGYDIETTSEDNSNVRVYPNPFSKEKHDMITLDYLDPNAFVDIYTISGKLLAHFDQTNSEYFTQTGKGSIFKWKIPQGWAPGTYIVAAKSVESGVTELRKFLIVP